MREPSKHIHLAINVAGLKNMVLLATLDRDGAVDKAAALFDSMLAVWEMSAW